MYTSSFRLAFKTKISRLSSTFLIGLLLILCSSVAFSTMSWAANGDSDHGNLEKGQLVNTPISGIHFKTSSGISGVTDGGTFQYKAGDLINFYIGEGDNIFQLGSGLANSWVYLNDLVVSGSKALNLNRLLISISHFNSNKNSFEIDPEKFNEIGVTNFINGLNMLELSAFAKQYNINIPSIGDSAIQLSNSYNYIKDNFISDEIVYTPMNKMLRSILIKTRMETTHPCFYDVSKIGMGSYVGPVGVIDFKLTEKGMTLYPSVGDYYGNSDNSVSPCDINLAEAITEPTYMPLEGDVKDGNDLFSCIIKGCTQPNLTGYIIEDHPDGSTYKYRAYATSFNPKTNIYLAKIQGLGKHEKIIFSNHAEVLEFLFSSDDVSPISLSGHWKEKIITPKGIQYRCLKMSDSDVWVTKELKKSPTNNDCLKTAEADYQLSTEEFGDMWWLAHPPKELYFYHLNIPTTWKDNNGKQRYTTWEYLPVSDSLKDGIVYRYQQNLNQRTQELSSRIISELTLIEYN